MLIDGLINEQNSGFAGKDGFLWWVGEVEDHEDPLELGRVKARILNYYTNPLGESAQKLPTENLPWASVLQGTDQAGNDGQGNSSGQLQPGAIVMGFFMDGEMAQMPIVMGVLRMDKSQTSKDNKFQLTGEDVPKGLGANAATLAPGKTNTSTGGPGSRQEETLGNNSVRTAGTKTMPDSGAPGSPKNLSRKVNGSSTNTSKPSTPDTPIPAAAGTGGPFKSLENTISYLVQDLIDSTANLVPNGSGDSYLDVLNGTVVNAQKLTAKLKNFISAVMTQVVAAMRQGLSDMIEKLEAAAAKITTLLGLPGGTTAAIQGLIQSVMALICDLDASVKSFLTAPIQTITNIVSSLVSGLIDKAAAALQSVAAVAEGIICAVEGMLSQIQSVLSAVTSIVNTAQGAKELLDTYKEGKKIFDDAQDIVKNGFDFTNVISLLTLLFDILGQFFNCERESTGGEDDVGWYPFFGTTSCTPSALAATGAGNGRGKCGGGGSGGFLDSFFEEADPYLTAAKNFVNGAYLEQIGTPGRQATIERSASGRTRTSVKANNQDLAEHKARKEYRKQNPSASTEEVDKAVAKYSKKQTKKSNDSEDQGNFVADHESFPGNYTQEVHGDDCKLVDGDFCRTISGDYRLKITGDCHIEVGGGYFLNAQGSPKQVDNKGEDKDKSDKVQKHSMQFGSDLDMSVVGANFKLNCIEAEVGSRELKMGGSILNNAYKVTTFSGGEFNCNAGNFTVNATQELHNIGMTSPSPLCSVVYNVKGPITFTQLPGVVPTPPFTVTTPGPFLVTCAAGGCTFTVGAGAFTANVGAGAIALNAGAAISLKAAAAISIAAIAACDIKALIINLN
tara:strand:- start:11 stop:2545 length:2535 start_codon:yes stop_codon:yes gene_type:complete